MSCVTKSLACFVSQEYPTSYILGSYSLPDLKEGTHTWWLRDCSESSRTLLTDVPSGTLLWGVPSRTLLWGVPSGSLLWGVHSGTLLWGDYTGLVLLLSEETPLRYYVDPL